MSDLGVAYINVVPSTKGIQSSMQEALGSGGAVGKELGNSISGGIGAGLKKGLAVAGAIGGAAVLAGKSLYSFTSAAAAAGDAVDKQSQKIGVSAEEYQLMAFAAERSGTSIATMTTAAKSLANSGFEGSVFDALEAVSAIADEEERAAVATELFGSKAAMELTPMLAGGAEGLQSMYEECKALGGVMSNETVAASASFADSLTNMQTAFAGVKNGIASQLMPGFTDVINGFAQMLAGNQEAAAGIADGISSIVQNFVDALPQFMGALAGIISAMAEQAPQIISALIVGIVSALPQILAAGGDIIIAIVSGVVSAIPQLAAQAPQIISALYNAIVGLVSKFTAIGKNIVTGIWQGISGSLGWIKQRITEWTGDVVNFLKSVFKIGSPSRVMADEVGYHLGTGVGLGFSESMGEVQKMMDDTLKTDYDFSVNSGVNSALAANRTYALGASTAGNNSGVERIVAALADLKQSGVITVEDPNRLFRLVMNEQRKSARAGVVYA